MKPKLRLVEEDKGGPSLSFLMRTRNPYLESPKRFERVPRQVGTYELTPSGLVEIKQ